MNSIKGKIFMLIGVLCIAGAVSLYMHNRAEDVMAGETAVRDLGSVMEQVVDGNKEIPTSGDMPAVDVSGNTYIGIVTVPSLSLQLPIQRDWSKANAKISPCRYKGSVYDNNLIVAAHNYERHFGLLKNLMSGDEVIITDMDGHSFYYQVVNTEIIDSFGIEEMDAGDWDLTLFTCTVGGQSRVTIRCAATGEVRSDWSSVKTELTNAMYNAAKH